MTEPQFFDWAAKYKIRFLGPAEHDEFVFEWKEEVQKRDLADMLAAIAAVAIDSRTEARFPRQHLRLLLEHADAAADQCRPGWIDPLAGEPPPVRNSTWNRWMLDHGVITKKEFASREKERVS